MNECRNYQEKLLYAVRNELGTAEQKELQQHLDQCPACREDMAATRQIWELMDERVIPAPSANQRQRFQGVLDDYKTTMKKKPAFREWLEDRFDRLWEKRLPLPWAMGFALMLLLLATGVFLYRQNGERAEMKNLAMEVRELKQDRLLSLLDNPAASERIRGISYSLELKDASRNGKIIRALLTTLNNDPNVNVRLTALETLADHFAGEGAAREGLVQSIVLQDSPMVQAEMADVMLKLQEKSAVPALKKLLNEKELEEPVRQKLTEAVSKLI